MMEGSSAEFSTAYTEQIVMKCFTCEMINTVFSSPLVNPCKNKRRFNESRVSDLCGKYLPVTTSQLSRMESYLATMSWAVGTCVSNQQFTSVLKLLKMHMSDLNEGANSVDYLKKVFSQTEGEEFQVIEQNYCHKCKKLFSGDEDG